MATARAHVVRVAELHPACGVAATHSVSLGGAARPGCAHRPQSGDACIVHLSSSLAHKCRVIAVTASVLWRLACRRLAAVLCWRRPTSHELGHHLRQLEGCRAR
eukprot:COSAG05_NODE_14922_length_383_cov_0.728873_1_plen_103_part_01